ncbi:hypothetical protein [Bacillus haynesii]|uniref:hypothetical protein n=1 Tax=Bacillus haynesii TaxID=1925021 RepID=UPI0022822418|nr:hypothetical protein [Bacillus haynesii]MCY8408969.1 hypothetical protein [Bacillus haynesii]MCY8433482.1 hypothetical protein [Bacillus haynesii]MCY8557838.1 hypothetical protein [Bacillus haynesii]
MYETRFLPLNLQFFADDAGDNDNNGGSEEGGQGDGQQTPGEQNGDAGNTGDSGEKTFTQTQLNSFLANERRGTESNVLKQLGDFESLDDAKAALQRLKDIEDSQKTEAQKMADSLKDYETKYNNVSSENESLKAQIAALKVGIPDESMEDVVALAEKYVSDDVDLTAAIEKVVEKYPHFKEQQQKQEPPRWTNGKHEKPQLSDVEALEEQMENAKTLPERVALRNKIAELKAKG